MRSLSLFTCTVLLKKLRGFQDFFRSCPFAKVFGQVPPAHYARSVHQQFRRTSNVFPVRTAAPVHQIIAANDFGAGVRQKRVSVPSLATERRGLIRRVHADRYRSHSPLRELTQIVLDTPQLGVAERSPISPVENQKQSSWFLPFRSWYRLGEQRGHRDLISAGIGKRKLGSLLPNAGRAHRCWQLARSIERCISEENGGPKTQYRKYWSSDLSEA